MVNSRIHINKWSFVLIKYVLGSIQLAGARQLSHRGNIIHCVLERLKIGSSIKPTLLSKTIRFGYAAGTECTKRMAQVRPLNAFITETIEQAQEAAAASDRRREAGQVQSVFLGTLNLGF